MSGFKFSAAQRYAVYTVHGSHCYLCGEPLYLQTMRIDHVLPRSLADDRGQLNAILQGYGLPLDFELDSYENWLPACERCNVAKGKNPFRPTPIIQAYVDRARSKAARVQALECRVLSDQAISKALNAIETALDNKLIDVSAIEPLIRDYQLAAESPRELRLAPHGTILYEGDSYRIVRAAYGVGYVPKVADINFLCPNCGNYGPWSGPRCLTCGHAIEED